MNIHLDDLLDPKAATAALKVLYWLGRGLIPWTMRHPLELDSMLAVSEIGRAPAMYNRKIGSVRNRTNCILALTSVVLEN
jgi:hypothetical protein